MAAVLSDSIGVTQKKSLLSFLPPSRIHMLLTITVRGNMSAQFSMRKAACTAGLVLMLESGFDQIQGGY